MVEIERDERTQAVTHAAGYRAFVVMSWLVVAVLAIRGWRPDLAQAGGLPADLLLIVVGGALTFFFGRELGNGAGPRARWAVASAVLAAMVVAAVMAPARG